MKWAETITKKKMQTNVKNCYEIKFMGFIVQQLRYIIFFAFIILCFQKPMSCQMQKRITSKTAADFSLRKWGHWPTLDSAHCPLKSLARQEEFFDRLYEIWARCFWQVLDLAETHCGESSGAKTSYKHLIFSCAHCWRRFWVVFSRRGRNKKEMSFKNLQRQCNKKLIWGCSLFCQNYPC